VPTWNYVAVHAYGAPRLIEDRPRVQALLARLVRTFEDGRPAPWRMDQLSDTYMDTMVRGIVAFEIPIDRLEGKLKLSQNRPAADRPGIVRALRAGGETGRAVADLMRP
jgi:transcriptional regulator